MLQKAHRDVMDVAKKIAAKCSYVAITTDGWSSPTQQSYWSVTLHMLDSSFRLHVHAVACIPVYHRHTADNLARYIRERLEVLGVSDNKIAVFVTDAGGAAPCISDRF